MREDVSPEEAARHRQTAAVAQRMALTEAIILLDARVKAIEKANPGRRKYSVTAAGQAIADAVRRSADMLQEMRDSISTELTAGGLFVPIDVFDRQHLERQVERLMPGTYSWHAGCAALTRGDAGRSGEGETDAQ